MSAENRQPIYRQITNLLRNEISSGKWTPGARLPTEEHLAKKHAVSRLTIRRMKEALAGEGMIHSIRGSGTYVNDPEKWPPRPHFIETIDDLLAAGKETVFRMHDFQVIRNTPEISEKLKNPEERLVFRMSGVRFHLGKPISYVVYHLPFGVGSKIPLDRLNENPLIPQLERLAGIKVSEGLYSFHPGRADKKIAEYLGVKRGALILVVDTTYLDARGRPVEHVKTRSRDDFGYGIRAKRA